MKLKAADGVVLVKPASIKDLTKKGTLEAVTEKQPDIGEVIDFGKPTKNKPMILKFKKGDIIAYRKFGESRFLIGPKEYIFVDFMDILGRIEK